MGIFSTSPDRIVLGCDNEYSQAVQHEQFGRPQEAAKMYRKIIGELERLNVSKLKDTAGRDHLLTRCRKRLSELS